MILSCHHISKSFLEVPVLTDVTFHLEKGEKAAIVGINGAGKSTLLKIITGEMKSDEGTVSVSKDTALGYLAQNQNLSSDRTIYEELLDVRRDIVEMEDKIARDEVLMTQLQGDELSELLDEYNQLVTRFRDLDGYAYKGEITGILRGLGFTESEFGQSIQTLSGGQKTRAALAKLLLEKPDLMLLDEPTNHLDIRSIRWLETYLSNYKGTVLIVSHDRYFLDKTVTKIIEIENTKAIVFPGNYSWYAARKEAMRKEAWHQYLNNQAEIRHQEEVIAKLRQFNREKSIKRAESRQKLLDKKEVIEKPVELRDDMRLVLRPCIRSGNDVMAVRHLTKKFASKLLFTDVTFDVRRGEHVALLGDNGTGKSTLLKIIIGQLSPDDGTVRFGTNVHIGYYDQEHHVLTDTNTVFDEIAEAHPDMTNTEIRNLLASFLFTGDDVFKRIGDLSGGEKGRVSLAKLMLSEANFLLLDEPTNHLDMVSKEILENALNNYEGTVFYVSHDRYFINHTASRIMHLTQNLLLDYKGSGEQAVPDKYIGNYDRFLQKQPELEEKLIRDELRAMQSDGCQGLPQPSAPDSSVEQEENGRSAGAEDYKRQKEEQARLRKKQNDIAKCEAAISSLEERNSSIMEEMALPENCCDIAKLNLLQKEQTENEAKLEKLYETWEALH